MSICLIFILLLFEYLSGFEVESKCISADFLQKQTYERDDGAFCSELSGAEERPDETVDQFVFWVYTGILVRHWLSL